jgi:prophage regulatory protein
MAEVKERVRKMLSMEDLLARLPLGKSTLKRMIKNKEFPSAHYITANKRGWYEDEVIEWQESLPAKSPRKRAKQGQSGSERAK